MTVLAIDQGTSGTKAIVVSDDGAVLGIAEEAVRPNYLPGGGVEQDPAQLLSSVLTAGRRAIAEAGVPVTAVSIANQGETVLAWDPDTGEPLSPAVVWQDRRAEAFCRSKSGDKDWVNSAPASSWTATSQRRRCSGCAETRPPPGSSRPATPGWCTD